MIGPNGAGKTTLFNVICGFIDPDSGMITWGGDSLSGVRPDRLTEAGIARTLQGVGMFARLTVLENVMVGAHRFRRSGLLSALFGLPRADRDEAALRERALSALERVGCREFADRPPGTLPYAIQKRVALARALVSEPKLLLLDEPAGGLGASDLSDLAGLIDSLRSTIAVMLVDHHMDLVTSVCDQLVVLDFGRVIAAGDPSTVRQDEQVLEAYLGRSARRGGGRGLMLTVEGLTTDYGPVRAVDAVSLEVSAGSVTAVLGANGAGKTSLLRTITGLVRPSAGIVSLDGEEITRLSVEEIVRRGPGPCSRGTWRDRRADRGGEPAAGRACGEAGRPRRSMRYTNCSRG